MARISLMMAAASVVATILFAAPGPARAAGCDTTFADARDFRAQLGLSTDAQLIRELATASHIDCTWGVPLTYAEAAEIQRRQGISTSIGRLKAYVEGHPDTFDVVYMDHAAGGIVVVTITSRATEAEIAEATLLVPVGVEVRFDLVRYSRDEISAAQDVASDLVFGEPSFEGVPGFGSGNIHNAVVFDVRCDRMDELAALLKRHLPAGILRYEPFGDCDLPDSSVHVPGPNEPAWLQSTLVALLVTALLALQTWPKRKQRPIG